MALAIGTESIWDLGLLGVNLAVLLIGIPVAMRLATAPNSSFRLLWPLWGLGILAIFAVFVYWARYFVK